MRAYTPSSLNGTLGAVEFVIKIYFPNDHPNFPDGGQLTQYLNTVNVGDSVEVKGPMGHIVYNGLGELVVGKRIYAVDNVTMIAGGTAAGTISTLCLCMGLAVVRPSHLACGVWVTWRQWPLFKTVGHPTVLRGRALRACPEPSQSFNNG